MTDQRGLERLRSHLIDTADPRPTPGQLAGVRAQVAATEQRPAWIAAVAPDGRSALAPDEVARARVAAAALLAAAVLLALLAFTIAGGREPDLSNRRSLPPTRPAIAVIAPPSIHPTTTPFFFPTAQPPTSPPTSAPATPCGDMDALATRIGAVTAATWPSTRGSGAPANVKAGSVTVWNDTADGTSEVLAVNPTSGASTPLLKLGFQRDKYSNLLWSPDGSSLAIGFGDDCGDDGVFLRTGTGFVRLAPNGEAALYDNQGEFTWAPDSGRLAIIPERLGGADFAANGGTHVWLVSGDIGTVEDLAPPCDRCNVSSFAWSPDGRWLGSAYQRFAGQDVAELGAAIADVAAGTWTIIPQPHLGVATLGWRDATHLVALSGSEVIEYDATDGARTVLPVDGSDVFAMVPGGRRVVTMRTAGSGAAARRTIGIAQLASGDATDIWTSPRGVELGGGIVAPDGSAVVLGGDSADGTTHDWLVRLDGSGARDFPVVDLSRAAWEPIVP